jgi:hypothetical protein
MHSRGLRGRSGKRLSTMGMWKLLGKAQLAQTALEGRQWALLDRKEIRH